jgi:predicted O-methyltransferase YrrM
MKFDIVGQLVRGVPFISVENARSLYELILRERITRILELGIAHGTATCYMAAALEELGRGSVTAVDLIEAQTWFKPSAEEQLVKARLAAFVQIVRMQTGYNWFLHDEIRRLTANDVCKPEYDLCILDGCKNWTIDGCAFFLADKVLKGNGWMIFDDYHWTYAAADARRDETDGVTHRKLSEAERSTPHVREIFELLVAQHPYYSDFYRTADGEWAIARKIPSREKTYTIHHRETFTGVAASILLGMKRRAKKLFGD